MNAPATGTPGDAERIAARAAELRARVEERLDPGEGFSYATWIARAPAPYSMGDVTATELHPKRLIEGLAWEAVGVESAATGPTVESQLNSRRRVLGGGPDSAAAGLDRLFPDGATALALALTDRRLVVLAKAPPQPTQPPSARDRLRSLLSQARDVLSNQPELAPIPPLQPQWHVPRTQLAGAHADANRLTLNFADQSWVVVVTPAPFAHAFAGTVDRLP
jgi:hypothetical protein